MAAKKKAADDAGAEEVQAAVDEGEEKGFIGEPTDPTPNENYTVEGVTADKPTPETDEKAAADAEARSKDLAEETGG